MFGRLIIEPVVQVDPRGDPQSAVATLMKVATARELLQQLSEDRRHDAKKSRPDIGRHRDGRFSS